MLFFEVVLFADQAEPCARTCHRVDRVGQVALKVKQHIRLGSNLSDPALVVAQHQFSSLQGGRYLDVENTHDSRGLNGLAVGTQAAVDVRVHARTGFQYQWVEIKGIASRLKSSVQVRFEEGEKPLDLGHSSVAEYDRKPPGSDEIAVQVVDSEVRTGQYLALQVTEIVGWKNPVLLAVVTQGVLRNASAAC